MSDLESRARAIVEAGRDADLPSATDHDRIKRAVLAQIAAGGIAASTAAAGTLSVGAKVGIAVLTLTLVGGGAVGLLKARDAFRASMGRGRAARAAVTAPTSAPIVEPVASQPPAAVVEDRPRRVDRSRKFAPPGSRVDKEADQDQVIAEVEVLKRAREELRLGRPARALDALVEYDRRFGQGVLGEERQAMAAIAACQAKPGHASRAQAETFVRNAPLSPLRERVVEACITPPAANSP
jgi:hypothetical protein